MRNRLISAALISFVAIASPAAAQYYPQNRGYGYGAGNVDRELDQIRERIQRAEQRDRISRGEAFRLLRQADAIDRLFYRYRRNGLTQWEARDIHNRVQNLRQRLRFERQEDRWDDRRDRRDDRDDRRDRWDDD
jgi:hypothetical protein